MFVRTDNNPNVFSYIEPHDYQHQNRKSIKSLDFNKMNERENVLIKKNPVPAVCTYDPKYETISSHNMRCIH